MTQAAQPTTFRQQSTGQSVVIKPPPADAKIEPKRRVTTPAVKGPFVKYVGIASTRIIRPHHWAQKLGAENLKNPNATHEWSLKNKKMIPSSEFSDHQLDYLLCDDRQSGGAHAFLEVEYNDKGQLVQVKN